MDIEYLLALQNIREGMPDAVAFLANIVTLLGIVLPLVVGVFAYWVFDKKFGRFVVFNTCFAIYVVQSVKLFFCVYRPWVIDSRVVPYAGAVSGASGYSFPSAHSAISSAACLSVAWWWRKRRVLCVCFVLLALLCAFTRNFLGVHTPQDVLVGIVVGILSVAVASVLLPWIEKGANRDIVFFVVCMVLAVLSMVFFAMKSYPMDYVNGALVVDPQDMMKDAFKGAGVLFGFAAGYLLERRVVKFETHGWSKRAVVVALIGAVLLGAIYLLLSKGLALFLPATIVSFVKIAAIVFFGVGVWPAAMKRFAWPDADVAASSDAAASPVAAVLPEAATSQDAAMSQDAATSQDAAMSPEASAETPEEAAPAGVTPE